ncbi:MAG: transglycosylase domain-containing protein [Tannerellaceae bacterium]|jgi:hypothetical protein|nr:transglycosylase domain-containing protein [Tannerellaceae bacterium]
MKKKYIIIVVVTLLLSSGVWIAATVLARQYAAHILQSVEKQYNINIRYQSVSLKSFNSLLIKGVAIVPGNSGLLLYAQSFVIKANFRKSSFSGEDIQGIEIDELDVHYTPRAKGAKEYPDYASSVRRIFEKPLALLPYLPPYVLIRNIHLFYPDKEGEKQRFTISGVTVSDHRFTAEMPEWSCQGSYQEQTGKVALHLYTTKKQKKVTLPFVEDYIQATVRFDTLSIELQTKRERGGVQLVRGRAGVKGLSLHQASLSSDTISIGTGYIHYKLLVGRNFIEVDSSATRIRYKRLRFNPYVRVEKNNTWRIRAALDKRDFPANDLFASLPKGLFYNLDGMKVNGTFSYHFLLDVDMDQVKNLVFESELLPRNFRIIQYGNTDLRKMSVPFVHTIYNKGKVVRRFEVGNLNPYFRPLPAISRYLPVAILHGEDFAFYYHRGFYPEAFHKSLVENIEAGKFLRGASTLSMQVVKNVFLSPEKTMARKLEEILIVWLIENNRLTHKSRMFEVYMNIIEWGPNVYGITEASHFYFAKEPSALTLGECIFLAYIIPYPKYIQNHFDGLRLKYPYYEFFHDAVRRLVQRGFITAEDASHAHADVLFRGPVVEYLTR